MFRDGDSCRRGRGGRGYRLMVIRYQDGGYEGRIIVFVLGFVAHFIAIPLIGKRAKG
jgi:hypothetical protein